MDRDRLVAAATEMNEVMGLDDPEIDVRLVAAKLEKQIRKAADLITEEDKFTKPTTAVLKELGLWPPKAKDDDDDAPDADDADDVDTPDDDDEPEEKPAKKKPTLVKKPAPKEDDEEEEEGDLASVVAKTGKLTDLKALVEAKAEFKKLRKSLDEYVGLQGPKQLKLAMYEVLGVEPPKAAPRASSGKKRGKGGHQLANELLEAEASQKEIYKAFTKLYAERGKEDEAFVKGRADIYMKIAKAEAKKEEAPVAKKSKKVVEEDDDES